MDHYLIENIVRKRADDISNINEAEINNIVNLCIDIFKLSKDNGIQFDETAGIVFISHITTFFSRAKDNKYVQVDHELFSEIDEKLYKLGKEAIEIMQKYFSFEVPEDEIFLIASHFGAMKERRKKEVYQMEKIKVVIGHRLGKGNNVAKGVEKAGGIAIVIPGVGADMKMGDVMHKKNADIGISFCGGGGGGALAASNKYGYKAKYDLRTIESGVSAIKEGYRVLGFSFLDVEELGYRIVKAYEKSGE